VNLRVNVADVSQSGGLDQVTVVVVTFNSAHCVAALAQALATIRNVIVVDNGSLDGTTDAVKRSIPQAQLIPNSRNLGFGAANNLALRRVETRFALLLNPDCETNANEIQRLLVAVKEDPGFAIAVPQLVSPSGQLEVNYRWPSTDWRSSGPPADGPCCVGFVCGAAMLFNMEVMSQVGFFDEEFFLYYEDDDLCKRVFDQKRQMLVIPSVRMTHRSRGSVGGKHRWRSEYLRGFHHAQSKIRFAKKYQGTEQAERLRTRTLLLAFLAMPLRVFLPVPRHLARLVGRVAGLWNYDIKNP
jgi:N-acetylglucosaminyl-diphospho-decaprenol L-rhamnosyltransferase